MKRSRSFAVLLFVLVSACLSPESQALTVASKKFTEGVILGEMARQMLERDDMEVRHRRELGGTRILWSALVRGDIDVYPEYTGTLKNEIFAGEGISDMEELRRVLEQHGIGMTESLGFNNTYVLGMVWNRAERLNITRISDLKRYPKLRFGLSDEFMDREDGWPALREHYGLPHEGVRGLDHDLAYRGLAADRLDVVDLYSTDAEIQYYDIRPLVDDRDFFPDYHAVFLYRLEAARQYPENFQRLRKLEGSLDEHHMSILNARVKVQHQPEGSVAADFIWENFGQETRVPTSSRLDRFLTNTVDHLFMVAVSLLAAVVIAIPLGIAAARYRRLGQVILGGAGIIQTIPALALLVFMIPLFGIGAEPAIAALFLYSLLPIIRNTCSGLQDIPASLRDSAVVLGLPPLARLRMVELPLAMRSILTGIKISAVINIGTATLGALIGAGGYGQPILTGIRLDDIKLIMEGAVPAAVLALLVQGFFELLERYMLPRGLRLKSEA
ncbi:MAG: glycine betaine ABC transporter substrate-binding protein [Gammaproteobacteria bacterium]